MKAIGEGVNSTVANTAPETEKLIWRHFEPSRKKHTEFFPAVVFVDCRCKQKLPCNGKSYDIMRFTLWQEVFCLQRGNKHAIRTFVATHLFPNKTAFCKVFIHTSSLLLMSRLLKICSISCCSPRFPRVGRKPVNILI